MFEEKNKKFSLILTFNYLEIEKNHDKSTTNKSPSYSDPSHTNDTE